MPECALASSIASRVSLVNLQKFTLKPCEEPPSMKMLAPAQKMRSFRLVIDDRVDLGVLEPDALHGVGELDVDAEVVGIQLQPVVLPQAALLRDVHRQRRNRAVERQSPVLVLVGRRFEDTLVARACSTPGLFMLVLAGVNASARWCLPVRFRFQASRLGS